jgi:hypothetical protein
VFEPGRPHQPTLKLGGKAWSLLANIRQGWKGLPGTDTSLLQLFVNYGCKCFITLGPRFAISKLPDVLYVVFGSLDDTRHYKIKSFSPQMSAE